MNKILLVEDDELISGMYQRVLSVNGYSVTVASDGEEGQQKLQADIPDIILLDIMMPKMSGLDLLKNIKNNPQTADIPVIVLTNLAGEKYANEAINHGALRYIIKSDYSPFEIMDMVKETLESFAKIKPTPVSP